MDNPPTTELSTVRLGLESPQTTVYYSVLYNTTTASHRTSVGFTNMGTHDFESKTCENPTLDVYNGTEYNRATPCLQQQHSYSPTLSQNNTRGSVEGEFEYEVNDHESKFRVLSDNRRSHLSLCSLVVDRPDSDFKKGCLTGGMNCWSEPSASTFPVRGANYIDDNNKVSSQESIFDLVDVDIFRNTTPGVYTEFATSGTSYIDYALSQGENRFMLMLHIQSNTFNLACTWMLNREKMEQCSSESRGLWERFLDGSDEFRNERFKIIPRVVEGNWLVMKTCGSCKPVLYATKLTHRYRRTDSFLEISCDTTSSKIAKHLADLCIGKAASLTLDMAVLVEGRDVAELPEQILGVFRMTKPDLRHCRKVVLPTPDEAAHVRPTLGNIMSSMSSLKLTTKKASTK
eukprot:CFRG0918T1